MAVETLLTTLERAATEAAERVKADALAEARTLVESAAAEAERRRTRALAEVADRAHADTARAAAEATRALRGELLARRAAVVNRVLETARARLVRLPPEAYAGAIGPLIDATVAYLRGQPAELVCQPELAPPVQAALDPESSITVQGVATAGPGLWGRSADDRVTVDNTLPALLDRRRPELAIAIARRLEEDGDAVG